MDICDTGNLLLLLLLYTVNMYVCRYYANTQGIMGNNDGLYVL